MTTQSIINALRKAGDLTLDFQLPTGEMLRSDYHITEFKNVAFDSVDCGGTTNSWQEVHIQLWEPPIKGSDQQMTASKAVGILDKVQQNLALHSEVEVMFEFGSSNYRLSPHSVKSIQATDGRLLVALGSEVSECKGLSSGLCGLPSPQAVNQAVKNVAESCCTPSSGCC